MVRRHELTDEQYAKPAPLPPPERPATGRPNRDHRTVLNGILVRLRTGAPWRDLPERDGPWQTVYSRFRRWQRAGVRARVLAALRAEADARGEPDRDLHFVDGTVVRAHRHAAGAQTGAPAAGRPTRRSAAPAAASRPSSTSAPRGAASRSPWS